MKICRVLSPYAVDHALSLSWLHEFSGSLLTYLLSTFIKVIVILGLNNEVKKGISFPVIYGLGKIWEGDYCKTAGQ